MASKFFAAFLSISNDPQPNFFLPKPKGRVTKKFNVDIRMLHDMKHKVNPQQTV